jgi:hypothetical protein
MTEDPDVSGGYCCTVSVINGIDENGKALSALFSVKAGKDDEGNTYSGWSIEQGVRQDDGTYKVDGKSATLLLGADVEGNCQIYATDKKDTIKKLVSVSSEYGAAFADTDTGAYIYLVDPFGTPGIWTGDFIQPVVGTGGSGTIEDPFWSKMEYGSDWVITYSYFEEVSQTAWLEGIHKGTSYSYYLVIGGVPTAEAMAMLAVGHAVYFLV